MTLRRSPSGGRGDGAKRRIGTLSGVFIAALLIIVCQRWVRTTFGRGCAVR